VVVFALHEGTAKTKNRSRFMVGCVDAGLGLNNRGVQSQPAARLDAFSTVGCWQRAVHLTLELLLSHHRSFFTVRACCMIGSVGFVFYC
jgi:hypothetical protein